MVEIKKPSIENKIEFLAQSKFVELAKLYADVFAGPPWNEYVKCPTTGHYFGRESQPGETCRCCNNPLDFAYPLTETLNYIKDDMSKPNAVLAIQQNGDELIGFAWGYEYKSPTDFSQEKYSDFRMIQGIKELLEQNLDDHANFYYFSECGVSPNQRGQGYSNQLTQAIIQQAKSLDLPMVMRTNCFSPMMLVAKKFGMRQIFGPSDFLGSCIVNYQSSLDFRAFRNFELGLDLENIPRTLFILP